MSIYHFILFPSFGLKLISQLGSYVLSLSVAADITPSQFIFIDGKWKMNDFNRCRFMRVSKEDNSPCGFRVGANPGKVWLKIMHLIVCSLFQCERIQVSHVFFQTLLVPSPRGVRVR